MIKIDPFKYIIDKKTNRALSLSESLEFHAGDKVAIVGPSGGGKSTFLKMIKGLIPTIEKSGVFEFAGPRTINNKDIGGINFNEQLQQIVYLFQNPFSQLIHAETEEEFLFSMENFKFSNQEIEMKLQEMSQDFDLDSLWGKKTSQLSNGECQKLVLASLMAVSPQIILLDEPTAFIDPESRKKIYELVFMNHTNKNQMVFIVDHYFKEIAHLVNRKIYVDENGNIAEFNKALYRSQLQEKIDFSFVENNQHLTLKATQLSFSYQRNKTILEGVNLKMESGEIWAIKGKNGSGKSTLIKLLAGILKPQQGQVHIEADSKIWRKEKLTEQIGFIFQNPENHFLFDTIREELNFNKGPKGSKVPRDLKWPASHLLANVNIDKSPFLLSEGEKRRLSVMLTLLLGKKIIIYDEPTFGQDEEMIALMAQIILELKNQNYLQIIVSHDDDFMDKIFAKKLLLKEGQLHEIN